MTDVSPLDLNDRTRPLIASRYRLVKELGKGSFCTAYLGVHVRKPPAQGTFCIKIEKTADANQQFRQLHFEAKLYELLKKEVGFPHARHFGKEKTFNFLAMELLGPNLEELFAAANNKFSTKSVCIMASQMLTRLEALHYHNFLHRDLKPENFLIGRYEKADTVYLCDMGLCKKYNDSKLNLHIPFQTNRPLAGTARYASANALSGNEQSRRDDMEALGYVLVYFMKGQLPWQGLKGENRREKYQRICDCKRMTSAETLCKGLPVEFAQYVEYVKSLKFDAKPDYNYVRGLFDCLLNTLNQKEPNTPCTLDWLSNIPDKFVDIIQRRS